MKKILAAGILLTSMVNVDVSDLENRSLLNHDQLDSQNSVAYQTVQKVNSYAKYGIYGIGRTAEVVGNGLSYLGNTAVALGTGYMLLEKTIVSNLIFPLTYGAQVVFEYLAWNASSKKIALPLKDLADTIEAKGAKTSYLSKLAWITTGVGFGVKCLGNSLSWLGKKAHKYASSN